ncbi:MAG: DUF885 domain-containing protein [candidate division Zixibacteria bacterium]|nr:DUF885 domain-containing protein [candidate division Zixibacteria bacterium]
MIRKIAAISLLTAFIISVPTKGVLAGEKQTFDNLCLEILETLQSFYPVRSTEMGIHAYDFLLADYSSGSVKKMIKKLRNYEKKLHNNFLNDDLSLHDRINYKLIKSNVDIALLELRRIRWYKKSPQLYIDEAVNGIYFLTISGHVPLHEKRAAILARMKSVPTLFRTARKNLKNPPSVWIETALESLESGMCFYKEVAGELMNKFPDQADEILKVSTAAREAMNDFTAYLAEIKTGDDTNFSIGRKNFDYKLSHEYFLDFDSDSLLKLGETLIEDVNNAYAEYEDYLENHQNGQDSVFVPANITKTDILDYYNWETRQIRTFLIQYDFITIPEKIAPVTVIETPPFLRTMISGIAYQPAGPFDSVQHGYFYVRPIPEDIERRQLEARYRYVHRRGFKGSVVHEAYPGHHLQMQLAGLNNDPVRKWQQNIMMIEGWALYCEEEMYHAGLYGDEDPVQWLGILRGIRFRAARIIADVKLHTGRFTYDEGVDWMVEALDINTKSGRDFIKKEVRRYTFSPAYQMSYLMGKLEILRLRDAVMKRDSDKFSIMGFHDALLAEGSIPPTLMWEVMELKPPEM